MGLLDKYIAATAGPTPDVAARLRELLGPEDELLAWGLGIAEAFQRRGSGRPGLNAAIGAAVNVALNAHAEATHVGGLDGSIGQTLPRGSEVLTLAISRSGLSAWKGTGYRNDELKAYYRIASQHITSITDTGKGAQGGARIYRVRFVDESFFDYRLMTNQAEFLVTATLHWPQV